MLDDALVTSFMSGFYGYGSYSADYWFVGMEEGGAGSAEEIVAHLEHWERRGRSELEDLRDFQVTKGNVDYSPVHPSYSRRPERISGDEGERRLLHLYTHAAVDVGRARPDRSGIGRG